jgi:ankyrin repeat protein
MRPIVRLLLYTSLITAVGIVVLAVRREVNTRLLRQAIDTGDRPAIQRLIAQGADINARGADGSTALISFAKVNERRGVHDLIRQRANLDAVDQTGSTALTYAAQFRHAELVRTLLEAGARTSDGRGRVVNTATLGQKLAHDVFSGVHRSDLGLPWMEHDAASIVSAVKRGADIRLRDEDGRTLLHLLLASQNPSPEHVRQLLRAGAEVEASDRDGHTPLLLAVLGGRDDLVGALVEEGADLRARDRWGLTPLLVAVRKDNLELLQWMVEEMKADAGRYSSASIRTELQHLLAAAQPPATPTAREAAAKQQQELLRAFYGRPQRLSGSVTQFELHSIRFFWAVPLRTIAYLREELARRNRIASAP